MGKQKCIKIITVDDHELIRRGLKLLSLDCHDIELVGEAENGEKMLAVCAQTQPDVILMDIKMPGLDGVSAIKIIRERFPQVQVIILTQLLDPELVTRALQAGAIGYVLKNVSLDDLAAVIRSAYAGHRTLPCEVVEFLLGKANSSLKLGHDLTERELEVLSLLVKGLNNVQIGQQLSISRFTVRRHVSNILDKLGVANRVEAVALAMKYQLVSKPVSIST